MAGQSAVCAVYGGGEGDEGGEVGVGGKDDDYEKSQGNLRERDEVGRDA